MRNQLVEAEMHLAAIQVTEPAAVVVDLQVEMDASVAPCLANFVRGHRDGREAGGGLGQEEAEAGAHLARREGSQADVVDLHQQQDAVARQRRRTAHRDIVDDDAELPLEVDAVRLIRQGNVVARPEHVVGPALIHQRDALHIRNGRKIECLLHERAVVEERRAIAPLWRAGQRRRGVTGVEIERVLRVAAVETIVESLQARRRHRPALDGGEERRGDRSCVKGARQVARDDDETSVLAAVLERGEFHSACLYVITDQIGCASAIRL